VHDAAFAWIQRGSSLGLCPSLVAAGEPKAHLVATEVELPFGGETVKMSSNREWIAFFRGSLFDGTRELWSSRRWNGSLPIRLGPPPADPGDIVNFAIAADSRHVV